jgi:ubiquinone/menaquinone biosynthesis C-methylase UbiE
LCCGTGFLALCLKKEGYLNYTGVDNNKNTIAAGKEIFKEASIEAKIFCEDACKTHFEDSSFDIVCAWQVSYFESMDVQALIKEAHRLLMNDGLFFMDVAGVKKLKWHQNVYSKKVMKELLNDFSDIRFHPLTAEKYIVSARRG